MDGGGGGRGGGRRVVFKIVSAIWRGRRREEGGGGRGGVRWSERNTRTKKETQASTSVRVTFFLTCPGLEPRRIIMEEGDLLQGA